MDTAQLGSGIYGHAATISVSPDGTNRYTFSNTPALFPQNAYRWDDPNHSWTGEQLNANKPLNPSVYTTDFAGQTVAAGLEQFAGSAGGTGYSLAGSGFAWIQDVRVQPASNAYTVIDAIAAADPVLEGDVLSIAPANVAAGATNLLFQSPANKSQTLISISDLSGQQHGKDQHRSFDGLLLVRPGAGQRSLCSCQAAARPIAGATNVALLADVGLSVGTNYAGIGGDLRVLQWNGTNWISPAFSYDQASREAWVAGLTNLSAFVVAQLSPPALSIQKEADGVYFEFVPFAGLSYTLQRSTDLLSWTPIGTATAESEQSLTMEDAAPPAQAAFYRLRVNP